MRPFLKLLFCWVLLASAAIAQERPAAEILVSRQLLEAHQLQIGDVVELAKTRQGANSRPYRIVGIYEPVPDPLRINQERWEARAHLPDLLSHVADLQRPADAETVHAINFALAQGVDPAQIQSGFARTVPDLVVQGTAGDAGPFAALEQFHLAIAVVTVLGATAFLLALIIMRADERSEIAGVLRLVGFSRRSVLAQTLFEGLGIATMGAVFGVVLALGMQGVVNRFFQWHYDTSLIFLRVTPRIALQSIAVAVPLGVLAGFVASWALLRKNIVELLRR